MKTTTGISLAIIVAVSSTPNRCLAAADARLTDSEQQSLTELFSHKRTPELVCFEREHPGNTSASKFHSYKYFTESYVKYKTLVNELSTLREKNGGTWSSVENQVPPGTLSRLEASMTGYRQELQLMIGPDGLSSIDTQLLRVNPRQLYPLQSQRRLRHEQQLILSTLG